MLFCFQKGIKHSSNFNNRETSCEKFVYVLKVTLVSIVMVGCHDVKDTIYGVSGTIDSLFAMDKAPQKVYEAFVNCDSDHCERIVTPGLKFTTGLVLIYDAMPTFVADININSKGQFCIDKLKTLEQIGRAHV